MVVFTCSYCGESVKKNQVEKHYNIKGCYGRPPALTCVDCLKDFMGNDYIAHTSCVTEDERYGHKGFVSKPPSDKGKKKQEMWVNSIKRVLECENNTESDVAKLLQLIASDSNIPQKKNKFVNFCTSKTRQFKLPTIERAWQLLEKVKMEQKQVSNDAQGVEHNIREENENEVNLDDRKRKRTDSSNESPSNSSNSNGNHLVEANSSVKKSKKSKREKQSCLQESSDLRVRDQNKCIENENSVVAINNGVAKDKKHRRHSDKGGEVSEFPGNLEENHQYSNSIKLSKKEKKQKLKQEKYEKQLMEVQNEASERLQEENGDEFRDEENVKSKKKKKVAKSAQANSIIPIETTNLTKKHDESIVNENKANFLNLEDASDNQPSKFNWEEIIIKVLEAKGELPLKRLEKKVVNEYINAKVHVESIEKVIAKFNKKIMKIPRVKVRKEVAKLVS